MTWINDFNDFVTTTFIKRSNTEKAVEAIDASLHCTRCEAFCTELIDCGQLKGETEPLRVCDDCAMDLIQN